MLFWPAIISIMLGIICGAFMPVAPFLLIACIGISGLGVSSRMAGNSVWLAFTDAAIIALILQISYVGGMFLTSLLKKLTPERPERVPANPAKLNHDIVKK